MHDYTAQHFHEDRMRELTRDADASRLAAVAREGQPRRHPSTEARRWLSIVSSRLGRMWRGIRHAHSPHGGFRTPTHAEIGRDL